MHLKALKQPITVSQRVLASFVWVQRVHVQKWEDWNKNYTEAPKDSAWSCDGPCAWFALLSFLSTRLYIYSSVISGRESTWHGVPLADQNSKLPSPGMY